jgi:hypothetical protein
MTRPNAAIERRDEDAERHVLACADLNHTVAVERRVRRE